MNHIIFVHDIVMKHIILHHITYNTQHTIIINSRQTLSEQLTRMPHIHGTIDIVLVFHTKKVHVILL